MHFISIWIRQRPRKGLLVVLLVELLLLEPPSRRPRLLSKELIRSAWLSVW